MSYNCAVCNNHVKHGTPLRRHIIFRVDGSIAQELPACVSCLIHLKSGVKLHDLRQMVREEEYTIMEEEKVVTQEVVVPYKPGYHPRPCDMKPQNNHGKAEKVVNRIKVKEKASKRMEGEARCTKENRAGVRCDLAEGHGGQHHYTRVN